MSCPLDKLQSFWTMTHNYSPEDRVERDHAEEKSQIGFSVSGKEPYIDAIIIFIYMKTKNSPIQNEICFFFFSKMAQYNFCMLKFTESF